MGQSNNFNIKLKAADGAMDREKSIASLNEIYNEFSELFNSVEEVKNSVKISYDEIGNIMLEKLTKDIYNTLLK